MSEKLPRVTANEIIRVLEKTAFTLARQSGSHGIYKNSAGRRVTVPYHQSQVLHPKLVAHILRDANISREEFRTLLTR